MEKIDRRQGWKNLSEIVIKIIFEFQKRDTYKVDKIVEIFRLMTFKKVRSIRFPIQFFQFSKQEQRTHRHTVVLLSLLKDY